MSEENTQPCVICTKQLDSAVPDDIDFAPYNGGKIKLVFTYGSTVYDDCPGWSEYDGHICDQCASKITDRMSRKRFGFRGEVLGEDDPRILGNESP